MNFQHARNSGGISERRMAEDSRFQRQTAFKLQIADLLKGSMIFDAEKLSAVDCNGRRVLRANIIGNIVDKYSNPEKQYASLTLDDGSGQIRLKGFSDSFSILSQPQIGDTVCVIGVVRFFSNELYIMPEVIREVEPKWLAVRKLELGIKDKDTFSEQKHDIEKPENLKVVPDYSANASIVPSNTSDMITTEKIAIEQKIDLSSNNKTNPMLDKIASPKLAVLSFIRKESEIDMEKLIIPLNIPLEQLNLVVKELIGEGEIYESRPGHLCAVS